MPRQSTTERGAEAHTPYSGGHEGLSSSDPNNNNIPGIDDASDTGLSVAVILLHLPAEAAEQETAERFARSDIGVCSLPQEASHNLQESPVKDKIDSGTETHREPGDLVETMQEYVIPVHDRPRPGHPASLTEATGYQLQEFPWSIELDVTWAILSAYFDLNTEYSVPQPIYEQISELSHSARIEDGGSITVRFLR
ncbi:hypothetical protein PMIN06_012163 [Paraphaeosphaeria minitans]